MEKVFDRTYHVLDAAVTSALISGVPPHIFNPILSFYFIQTAATASAIDRRLTAQWELDPSVVWDPTVEAITQFANDFDGEMKNCGEVQELEYLRSECKVKHTRLSELDDQRENNKALHVMDWVISVLNPKADSALLAFEMSLIAAWFKIAALDDEVDDKTFVIVKQNLPDVLDTYCRVLDRI